MAWADNDELDRLRREYEDSTSWRLTRPVRALGRAARALSAIRSRDPDVPRSTEMAADLGLDSWLEHFYGERLQAIDSACAAATPDACPMAM